MLIKDKQHDCNKKPDGGGGWVHLIVDLLYLFREWGSIFIKSEEVIMITLPK